MPNVYFDLTAEFNAKSRIAVLTSGQAAVFYRTAIMSKDGDWVLRETTAACEHVLGVLSARGARYRLGAPLDVRWLRGGWSSHFEFADEKGRRIRCDFLSRPPRLHPGAVDGLFRGAPGAERLAVIDLENLIRMKQTQRLKDYAVIGELARLLPPEREVLYTTDPDRVLALAEEFGPGVERSAVREARGGAGRDAVAVALAREMYALQEADRLRLSAYEAASRSYLERLNASDGTRRPLSEAHPLVVALAEECLPESVAGEADGDLR